MYKKGSYDITEHIFQTHGLETMLDMSEGRQRGPLNASGSMNLSTPYETFLERSAKFHELNRLPVPLGHLRENINAEDLVENKASWHKSCHKKFDQDKLDRAQRKRNGNEIQDIDTKRTCPQRRSLEKFACILCEEETGTLHEFRTLDADTNIRKMATELQDAALLAKLEGGDLIALEAKYHLVLGPRPNHYSQVTAMQILPGLLEEGFAETTSKRPKRPVTMK